MSRQDELREWKAFTAQLTSIARAAMEASSSRTRSRVGTRSIPQGAYLSLREVARLLRVSQSKVAKWISNGKLQALDVGRPGRPSYRISKEALDKSLGAATSPPQQKRASRKPPGFIEKY